MSEKTTVYSPLAFEKTSQLKARISVVATQLGLNPEAIYGAMVEENHSYQTSRMKNMMGDAWTMVKAGPPSESQAILLSEYQRAKAANKLDRHSTWDKLNPVLNDIGPYNYKLATAIRFLQQYLITTKKPEDPLNLRRYADDYRRLAIDLISGEVVPEFAGLMLSEAKHYMQQYADPSHWNELSEVEKDALYLTYYNMGPAVIEEKRQQQLAKQGLYKPAAGAGTAAGKDHIENAPKIGQIFAHPDYASPAPPAAPTPAQPAPVSPPPVRVERASSASFVRYHDKLTAELEPGGSLSDIVAVERAQGNLITIGDLRAVNGLDASQDRRIRAGYRLLIPQRSGKLLQAEDEQAKLSLKLTDGSLSAQYTGADGSILRCSRRWDAERSVFIDHYENINAAGATQQTEHEVSSRYVARFLAAYQTITVEHIEVSSSNIASIGYNDEAEVLSVRFLNERLYEYYQVPRSCFDAFLAAPSKGKFLYSFIMGVYPYARVDDIR